MAGGSEAGFNADDPTVDPSTTGSGGGGGGGSGGAKTQVPDHVLGSLFKLAALPPYQMNAFLQSQLANMNYPTAPPRNLSWSQGRPGPANWNATYDMAKYFPGLMTGNVATRPSAVAPNLGFPSPGGVGGGTGGGSGGGGLPPINPTNPGQTGTGTQQPPSGAAPAQNPAASPLRPTYTPPPSPGGYTSPFAQPSGASSGSGGLTTGGAPTPTNTTALFTDPSGSQFYMGNRIGPNGELGPDWLRSLAPGDAGSLFPGQVNVGHFNVAGDPRVTGYYVTADGRLMPRMNLGA